MLNEPSRFTSQHHSALLLLTSWNLWLVSKKLSESYWLTRNIPTFRASSINLIISSSLLVAVLSHLRLQGRGKGKPPSESQLPELHGGVKGIVPMRPELIKPCAVSQTTRWWPFSRIEVRVGGNGRNSVWLIIWFLLNLSRVEKNIVHCHVTLCTLHHWHHSRF